MADTQATPEELLRQGATDAIESGDYISYSTVVDITLADPISFESHEERESILKVLLDVLEQHPDLTYEIGWDIPSVILPYVESDYDFFGPLRSAPCVLLVIKIFEVLAKVGNAKELFLKSCELISQLNIREPSPYCDDDDHDTQTTFFEIKLFCLMGLMNACLKRIKTKFPSRFLAMSSTSILNMLSSNNLYSAPGSFAMKRVYQFVRDYEGMEPPEEGIEAGEETLQRKLLQSFLTSAVHLGFKDSRVGFTADLVSFLQRDTRKSKLFYVDFELDAPVCDRLYELCISIDVSPKEHFENTMAQARKLVPSKIANDDEMGLLFEKIVKYYQQSAGYMVTGDVKSLKVAERGAAILYTHQVAKLHKYTYEMKFSDAIKFFLLMTVPAMVNPAYKDEVLEDVSVFWMWYSLHADDSDDQVATVDASILTVVFQTLLHLIVSIKGESNLRYCSTTLLIRLLTLTKEETAWKFISESLASCPYDNIKLVLIGVLKDLLIKDRPVAVTNGPPLPVRKFISFDEDRGLTIFEVIAEQIGSTFVEEDGIVRLNPTMYSSLSGYFNLLVALKVQGLLETEVMKKSVEKYCGVAEKKIAKMTSDDQLQANAADMLSLTITRIRDPPTEIVKKSAQAEQPVDATSSKTIVDGTAVEMLNISDK